MEQSEVIDILDFTCSLIDIFDNYLIRRELIDKIGHEYVKLRLVCTGLSKIIYPDAVTKIINFLENGGQNAKIMHNLNENDINYIIQHFVRTKNFQSLATLNRICYVGIDILRIILVNRWVDGFRWSLTHMKNIFHMKNGITQENINIAIRNVIVELSDGQTSTAVVILLNMYLQRHDFIQIMLKAKTYGWMRLYVKYYDVWGPIAWAGMYKHIDDKMFSVLPQLNISEWERVFVRYSNKAELLILLTNHDIYLSMWCYIKMFTDYPYSITQPFLLSVTTDKKRSKIVNIIQEHPLSRKFAQMLYYPDYDYSDIFNAHPMPKDLSQQYHGLDKIFALFGIMFAFDLSQITDTSVQIFDIPNIYSAIWEYDMRMYLYIVIEMDGGAGINKELLDQMPGSERDKLKSFIKCIVGLKNTKRKSEYVDMHNKYRRT